MSSSPPPSDPSPTPDPYQRDPTYHLDPPRSPKAMFRYWGPGLVLTASVVGSGELIATTGLGATVGYLALWLIILSCFIKVAIQLVLGRYAIYSGETTLQFLDRLPGPRLGGSWFTWLWIFMLIMVNVQQGAMLGGVALALHLVFPQIHVSIWALVTAASVIVLLRNGRYSLLEHLSTAMVAAFTLTTLVCVALLRQTAYSFSAADLWEGLQFHLPADGVTIAVAAFGITGIGSSELIYYPYWCIEKGYARAVGVYEDTEAWFERARGWIATMNWDALLSMGIYTVLTLAFYTLGASVLHTQGLIPEGMEMVQTLSRMYTEILGLGAFYLFLLGAFFALFSTLFVSVAANARVLTDCFGLIGWARLETYTDRLRWIRWLVTLQPLLHFVLFLAIQLPLWMVVIGGMAQALMLPIIALATLYLRYQWLDKRLAPSKGLDVLLWLSVLSILAVGVYGLIARFGG